MLFESDTDSKIQKTKSHIDHLLNAQSQNTHGGKRFRAKQISLRDQIDSSTKRLALLTSAKKLIAKLDKEEKHSLVRNLTKNSVALSSLVNRTFGWNHLAVVKSYTEGQSISLDGDKNYCITWELLKYFINGLDSLMLLSYRFTTGDPK